MPVLLAVLTMLVFLAMGLFVLVQARAVLAWAQRLRVSLSRLGGMDGELMEQLPWMRPRLSPRLFELGVWVMRVAAAALIAVSLYFAYLVFLRPLF